jgi:hypothetical protein
VKVRLIDSLHGLRGLRGRRHRLGSLRAIPTDRRDAAREALTLALEPVYDTFADLQQAAQRGTISLYDSERLETRYHDMLDRVEAHFDALDPITADKAFQNWTTQADALATELGTWNEETRALIGYETSSRWWRIGLLSAGAAALLGGFAWVIVKKGRRK